MIAVIGAGIMGRTLAWHLAKKDFKVALFDRDDFDHPSNCSSVAAGMISPFSEATGSFPSLSSIGLHAIEFWKHAVISFKNTVFYSTCGSLCTALAQHQQDLLQFKEVLLKKEKYLNFHSIQVQELESEIESKYRQGIYLPDEAQISAKMLLDELLNELKGMVSGLYPNEVVFNMGRKITSDRREIDCEYAIDCRGLGAKEDLKTLRGVRGEIVTLEALTVSIKHVIRIFHPRQHVYIIPRPNRQYILGSSCIDSSDTSPISVRTIMELLSLAYSVHKGFLEARILSTNVHCRPAFENNLPRILVDSEKKIIRVNGLYRYGFLFTPTFVEAIECFLTNHKWPRTVAPFVQES